MEKKNIFFIQPLFYNPTLPNFKDRFDILSERCCGDVVSVSDRSYDGLKFSEFTYHALPYIRNRFLKYPYYVASTVRMALRANRQRKIDYVHSYDPLVFGATALLIKIFTGAKMVVEVNGNLLEAGFLDRGGLVQKVKKRAFRILIGTSLLFSNTVKFLNRSQQEEWRGFLTGKKTALFHDFVPTHVFDPARSNDGNYILFMGHPFHSKGVDVLIKAFLKVCDAFPEARLKIIGHASAREREEYLALAGGNKRIEILKPVYYDEAQKLFQDCTFFVLPSRSEAMGRVIIEAMACGKAVIGSNTGGIPGLIEDKASGYLFEPGDVDGLAYKMKQLLSDRALRERMGKRGAEIVKQRLSSQKYAERFYEMISA